MANDDVRKMLESRLNEISSFLESMGKEREHTVEVLNRIDDDIHNAERDHRRIQRAINAINGDDEPQKAMAAAVESLAASECGEMVRGTVYHPGR